jgi:hypothetical protein
VDEMPRLLASFSEPHELLTLVPRLPSSWVLKPAGAADSFGVTVVRGGSDVTRGGVLLDVVGLVASLDSVVAEQRVVMTDNTKKLATSFAGRKRQKMGKYTCQLLTTYDLLLTSYHLLLTTYYLLLTTGTICRCG